MILEKPASLACCCGGVWSNSRKCLEAKADGLGTVTNKSAQGLLASTTYKPPTPRSLGAWMNVNSKPSPMRNSQLGEGLAFRQRLMWDPWGGIQCPSSLAWTAHKPSPVLESGEVGFKWQKCTEVKHTHLLQRLSLTAVAASDVCDKVQHQGQWPVGLGEQAWATWPGSNQRKWRVWGYNPGEWDPVTGSPEISMQPREMNLKSKSAGSQTLLPNYTWSGLPSISILQPERWIRTCSRQDYFRTHSLFYLLFRRNGKFRR